VIRYFDASAWVKRYVQEAGSEVVRRLVAGSIPATNRLTEVEVALALVRRTREGTLPADDRDRALTGLRRDFEILYVVELLPEVSAEAIVLLRRYPLRSHDALQLAGCLFLQRCLGEQVELVAFDARLVDVARREGVVVKPAP
jgi:predicted nucleic acid-binding protein